jgi:hypothetical protein
MEGRGVVVLRLKMLGRRSRRTTYQEPTSIAVIGEQFSAGVRMK